MDKQKELRILRQLEIASSNAEKEQQKLKAFLWFFRLLGLLGVLLSALLMKTLMITTLAGSIIAAAGGLLVGLSIYFKISLEQTPIILKYIDIERIRERLR